MRATRGAHGWPGGASNRLSRLVAIRSVRPTRMGASCGATAAAGWWRVATYNTPIQTNSSYPIIGLSGLLNLVVVVEKFRPQAEQEKGTICQPTSSPPPLGHGELIQVGMRLPAANRQRLLRLLSQRLEHQLRAAAAPGEDSDESATRN